jgi:ribosomal protein S18 acetylase RimI-like enzyme
VSETQGQIVGYVVAITGGKSYWSVFACRYPLVAAQIILKRAQKRLHRVYRHTVDTLCVDHRHFQESAVQATDRPQLRSDADSFSSGIPSRYFNRSWEDEGPGVAKILHVGVHPEARGHGVGQALYRCLFDNLRLKGIARVDATINWDNTSSILLHQRSGWTLIPAAGHWFATIDL